MKNEFHFSPDELQRYQRQMILPGLGMEGQERLRKARVLVVGAGGLGAPLLLYLTAAGVGTIGIVDADTVQKSNLHRQVLYTSEDEGKSKVQCAIRRLCELNPNVNFIPHEVRFTAENAMQIASDYDVVADGTDNFATRYLVNDTCVLLGKPNVFASIFQFDGQVSVFNLLNSDGSRGPNYRDLFPTPPPPGSVLTCEEGGVLGVLPGIIGSLQALEVMKVITGVGEPLSGKLFSFNALTFSTRVFSFTPDPENPISGKNPTIHALIDYELFCNPKMAAPAHQSGTITASELKALMDRKADFQLIDVREEYEYEEGNLGGVNIPLGTIADEWERINQEGLVVIHCRSGARSAQAIKWLETEMGFRNLVNLGGGILAFK
jgi:sulfur-carrier protein adenylyltransferase/sulfurtransferase